MDWSNVEDSINKIGVNTFGVLFTYMPNGGSPFVVRGVFKKEFVEVNTGQGIGTASLHPTLGIRLSDLDAKPTFGDQVQIGTDLYNIIESQEDGGGGAILILQK
ncbi:MAG: hypothetical protein SGI74_12935 [Oligoflexia bacterium]|nr:hypothetical protein [Oligoflexia bacterium]